MQALGRIAVIAFLGVVSANDRPLVRTSEPIGGTLVNLSARITRHEVGRVEMFYIPGYVLTRARITPEVLEKQYRHMLVIRDIRGESREATLAELTKNTVVERISDPPDLRSSIVFYDSEGTRIGIVAFDRGGTRGMIDGHPVSLHGGLYAWMQKLAACVP